MPRRSRIIWGEPETDMLVSERRHQNSEYHFDRRGDKTEFWESVARRINRRYHTHFNFRQCERKWRNLIKDYGVSTITIII